MGIPISNSILCNYCPTVWKREFQSYSFGKHFVDAHYVLDSKVIDKTVSSSLALGLTGIGYYLHIYYTVHT